MTQPAILQIMQRCGCKGCIREGKFMPFVVVRMVGQTVVEKSIKAQIPMYLCEKHKAEANPNDMLTKMGRKKLEAMVAIKYRKRINWDTISLEWQEFKPKVIH